MDINNSIFNSLQIKPIDKKNEKLLDKTSNPVVQNTPAIKSDSIKLSGIAQKTDPKSSIVSLGEKLFNNPVLDHFKSLKNKPEYKPIINKLEEAITNNAGIKDLERTAINTVKSTYPKLSNEDVIEMAYNSCMSAVTNNKYSDPKFFNGERDKVFHYFTSAALTATARDAVPLLPNAIKDFISSKSILTIGWLKEVASIPGNGYGADDMIANRAGIKAAIDNLHKLQKDQSV